MTGPELTPVGKPRLTPARLRIYQAESRRSQAYVRQVNAELDLRLLEDLRNRIAIARRA